MVRAQGAPASPGLQAVESFERITKTNRFEGCHALFSESSYSDQLKPRPHSGVSSFAQTRNMLAHDGESNEKRLFMDLNEPFKGACGDCALSCYRSHGANRDGSRNHLRPPCFTKLVADSSVEGGPSCWMKVPEAFVAKYLPHVNQKRMILENRDGVRWPVMYSAAHGFQLGWSEFSIANELAVGETLFFSLVEENKFVVHVFEKSCCEKRLTSRTTMPTSSTVPSSSTRQRRKSVPDDIGRTPTRTPTPMPAFKSFSRFRPDEPGMDIERELRFGKNGREGTSPGAFYGMPHRSSEDDDNAATLQNQQRNRRNPKDGTSDTRKSHSGPTTRSWNNLSNIETGSFFDTGRRRSTPNLKGQSEGYLRVKRIPMPKWGPTLSQLRARAAVEKAKLKKMNLTDLPASEHRESSFKGNQNPSLKRKNMSVEASSDGRAFPGPSEGRSFSKEDAFISSRDSARDTEDEEERAADLRNIQSYNASRGKTITQLIPVSKTDQAFPSNIPNVAKMSSRRHGGNSSSHQQQDSLEFASPRTPGRLQTDPLAEQMRVPCNGFKPKRGRPFKHHPTPDSMQKHPAREIFVSRRRPVTQLEKDEALTAAYSFAAHINASHISPTTFILVMRQSFVYRNFVLGLPRGFGQRHMPPCSKEVTFVDSAWKAWLCSWNNTYSYIAGRGWRNFALEHCIEEDDVLLFHILSETDAMLIIKVHIFRVVAIPDGLTGWESHVCPKNAVPEIHSGATMQPIVPHVERPQHPHVRSRHDVECPRLQSSRHQESADKKIKREPATEVSAVSESSEELD